jgi:hypothetical protein
MPYFLCKQEPDERVVCDRKIDERAARAAFARMRRAVRADPFDVERDDAAVPLGQVMAGNGAHGAIRFWLTDKDESTHPRVSSRAAALTEINYSADR